MKKEYFRIIFLIGFIESLVIISLGWIITRQMVNFKVDLHHNLLGFENLLPDYINNQIENLISLGNFMMIFSIIFSIIFLVCLIYSRKDKIEV